MKIEELSVELADMPEKELQKEQSYLEDLLKLEKITVIQADRLATIRRILKRISVIRHHNEW